VRPVFESSHPFAFFDYFRVPYQVTSASHAGMPAAIGRLQPEDHARHPGPSLLWLVAGGHGRRHPRSQRLGRFQLNGFTFVGHLSTADPVAMLETVGAGWRPTDPIRDSSGHPVSAVWRDDHGSVFLPFDPGEVMHQLWSESYTTVGSAALLGIARLVMIRAYYVVRPLLPRRTQLAMRRVFARRQGRPAFPAWPVEHSLHDMYSWLFATVTGVAGRPVPWLDPWPTGRSWALVLTHDVETDVGYADLGLLRDGERAHGYRSSWNFVPERYDVDEETLNGLRDEGCEIGVHGLRHDGRDLGSARLLDQRLPAIRAHADRWGAVGFRSPGTQRSWELMPRLGFEYDSSYPDTDPYEPQPGGCCTYLPFFNEQMVELPITLPQDHTMFEILGHTDGDLWTAKARDIRARGGMVLALTHPDYARNDALALAWKQLLDEFADDDSVWQALPREVASWWRRRQASSVILDDDRWVVRGPAAGEAQVRLTVFPAASTGVEK
jgi:hypothetical protein